MLPISSGSYWPSGCSITIASAFALEGLEVAGLLIRPVTRVVGVPYHVQRQATGQLERVVARRVIDKDDLVDPVHRNRPDGPLERARRVHRRHHHDHLPVGRSDTPRLDVDGPPAAAGDLDRSGADCGREEHDAGGQRRRSAGRRQRPAARLATADRVVQVGAAGQRSDQPMQPPEHGLAAAPVADARRLEAELAQPSQQDACAAGGRDAGAGRGETSGRRRGGPARCRCWARAIRRRPPGSSWRAAWASAAPGAGRCSSECQKTIADQLPSRSSMSARARRRGVSRARGPSRCAPGARARPAACRRRRRRRAPRPGARAGRPATLAGLAYVAGARRPTTEKRPDSGR